MIYGALIRIYSHFDSNSRMNPCAKMKTNRKFGRHVLLFIFKMIATRLNSPLIVNSGKFRHIRISLSSNCLLKIHLKESALQSLLLFFYLIINSLITDGMEFSDKIPLESLNQIRAVAWHVKIARI